MTYIQTGIKQPGIIELLYYKSSTGKALSDLAHTLMHGSSKLCSGERELIASFVSKLNECEFCHESHSAATSLHFGDKGYSVRSVIADIDKAPVSGKMKALLRIAEKVQRSGREVRMEDIKAAKMQGAMDEEIHDTVLIAAAFCMYNRYVDGLGTNLPKEKDEYLDLGKRLAKKRGYKYPPLFLRKFIIRMMNKKSEKNKS